MILKGSCHEGRSGESASEVVTGAWTKISVLVASSMQARTNLHRRTDLVTASTNRTHSVGDKQYTEVSMAIFHICLIVVLFVAACSVIVVSL